MLATLPNMVYRITVEITENLAVSTIVNDQPELGLGIDTGNGDELALTPVQPGSVQNFWGKSERLPVASKNVIGQTRLQ